jgi:hypothetical protein
MSDLATHVLDRLGPLDRGGRAAAAAIYTDTSGVRRFHRNAPATPAPQRRLPLRSDEE